MSNTLWRVIVAVVGILAVVALASTLWLRPASYEYTPGVVEEIALENPLRAPGLTQKSVLPLTESPADGGYGGVDISDIPAAERLVVRTGNMSAVVRDIKTSIQKIKEFSEGKGGWVVQSSAGEQEQAPTGSITFRVPAANFDEALAFVRGLSEKVSFEQTQGQDVTEEYVDLDIRVKNLETTEQQLRELLKRSGSLSDVLEVQRELTNVREQIERLKGRMQYLSQSAKMSTITVNLALSEDLLPIPPSEKWRPLYVLKQAWRGVLNTLRALSYIVIWLVVFAIIWVPAAAIIWFVRKRLKLSGKLFRSWPPSAQR